MSAFPAKARPCNSNSAFMHVSTGSRSHCFSVVGFRCSLCYILSCLVLIQTSVLYATSQEEDTNENLLAASSKRRGTLVESCKARNQPYLMSYLPREPDKVITHFHCYHRFTDKQAVMKFK